MQQKQFELLTDKELLELTQEEIDWYIKLKKAEAGIRIVSCPATPEYRPIPEKDMILYDVAGFNFINREIAEKVAKVINDEIINAFKVDYDWGVGGSDYKYAKPYSGNLVDITIEKVFSEVTYVSIKNILISNKKIEDAYNKLKNEYDEQEEKSQELVDKIYSAISEAKERKEQFADYIFRIQDYLRLANGDTTIAWNFFEKAYTIEISVKNKILASEEYQTAIKGY